MDAPHDSSPPARMLFLGEQALTDGFQLIGFETYANPNSQQIEQLLSELITQRVKAFVVLGSREAESDSPSLKRIQAEGGHIVVTQVPPLNNPEHFHSETDDKVQALLGDAATLGKE